MTQLVKMKLESRDLGTGQQDTNVGTLEEYVVMLSFELPQIKFFIVEIVLGVEAYDPYNGTQNHQ